MLAEAMAVSLPLAMNHALGLNVLPLLLMMILLGAQPAMRVLLTIKLPAWALASQAVPSTCMPSRKSMKMASKIFISELRRKRMPRLNLGSMVLVLLPR